MLAIILTLLLLLGATWLLAVFALYFMRSRPPRLHRYKALYLLGRTDPGDLGFAYEVVSFPVRLVATRKEIQLQGWLIRHPEAAGQLVVVLHGFADAKVGAAAWLPTLHDCKVNVLLLDLPAHGESEGTIATAALQETPAVISVLEQLRQKDPDVCRRLILFGISMGAAVAASVAKHYPETRALVMDCPFADFRKAVHLHARLFGLPGAIFQAPATWLTQWLHGNGKTFAELSPSALIRELSCPILLIQAGRDALITSEDAERMRDDLLAKAGNDGKSEVLLIEEAHHILALAADPERYRQTLQAFLARI